MYGGEELRHKSIKKAEILRQPHPMPLKIAKSYINPIGTSSSQNRRICRSKRHENFVPKPKASKISALALAVGAYQIIAQHDGDIETKFYYARRKVIFEILNKISKLKSKIEIDWNNISSIRAIMPDNERSNLEIEVIKPPLFFQEKEPEPMRQTAWKPCTDFTGGEALKFRKYLITFPPEILETHYETLLLMDENLLKLSQTTCENQIEGFQSGSSAWQNLPVLGPNPTTPAQIPGSHSINQGKEHIRVHSFQDLMTSRTSSHKEEIGDGIDELTNFQNTEIDLSASEFEVPDIWVHQFQQDTTFDIRDCFL